jgi:hypothetical protein
MYTIGYLGSTGGNAFGLMDDVAGHNMTLLSIAAAADRATEYVLQKLSRKLQESGSKDKERNTCQWQNWRLQTTMKWRTQIACGPQVAHKGALCSPKQTLSGSNGGVFYKVNWSCTQARGSAAHTQVHRVPLATLGTY